MRNSFLATSLEVGVELKKLKHIGKVWDYVKKFTLLLFDVKDMSDEDKLFNFLLGIQN